MYLSSFDRRLLLFGHDSFGPANTKIECGVPRQSASGRGEHGAVIDNERVRSGGNHDSLFSARVILSVNPPPAEADVLGSKQNLAYLL